MDVGLCSWLVDRHDPVRAIAVAGEQIEVGVVQVGFFGARAVDAADPQAIRAAARACGVRLAGTFLGFDGEDYTSISTIAATGGLLPDATCHERSELFQRAVELTARLGCDSIAIHPATIPQAEDDPAYGKLVERVGALADTAAAAGVSLLLETGREPIATLMAFVDRLSRPNVAFNFDPGNLVLYGVDEPVRAVAGVAGRARCVHVKDAVSAAATGPGAPGFGSVVPLGSGEVRIPRVISKLRAAGYAGPLLVEKTGSGDDVRTVRDAVGYMRSLVV